MNPADAVAFLDELLARRESFSQDIEYALGGDPLGQLVFAPVEDVIRWLTHAELAISAFVPAGNVFRTRWAQTVSLNAELENVRIATSLLLAVRELYAGDRLPALLDGVRAESVGELLEQADVLLASGYLPAATTIAGGALETHLRHLCDRAGCTPAKHSISTYEQALAQERKAGREVISTTDGKSVTAWGGLRNEAAHNPGKFAKDRSKDEVHLFIEGVRQFVGRTS